MTSATFCHLIRQIQYYEVIAGDLILSDNSGLEQRSKIKDYLIHPDYEVGHLLSQLGWNCLRKFLIQYLLMTLSKAFLIVDDQTLKSTQLLDLLQMMFVWYIWNLILILVEIM